MNELQYEMIGQLGVQLIGFGVGAYIIYRLIKKKLKKKTDLDN